ncbi:MAG: efflux RND transporter periplasmic adaptor subunit [Rhodospirillales bacterium]
MIVALAAVLAGGAGAAGYWTGQQRPIEKPQDAMASAPAQEAALRKITVYRDPYGTLPDSPAPRKNDRGEDFITIELHQPGAPPAEPAKPGAQAAGSKKVLYYRNPMGLPDTSPTPKKDWMGMDYIAVYEGEEQDAAGTVKVSLDKVQKLGVRTEAAIKRKLEKTVRAAGTVQIDEKRQQIVSTRYEGWIERLVVNTTGQAVRRGDVLMEVYSPELVLAQQEYVAATSAGRDISDTNADLRSVVERVAEAALQRLRNLDVPQGLADHLKRGGAVRRLISVHAPTSGVVVKKNAIQGMRFMPGDTLYEFADISQVWLIADVFEQDLGLIREGQLARVIVNAFPSVVFEGKVEFIYPVVSRETRTAKVRLEVPNTDGRLRADMYATVEIAAAVGATESITVPVSAVLDSGMRQAVLVERGAGRYEPRPVKLGARTETYIEILDGLAVDEKVVVSANFLIDAESNLKAALGAFTAPLAKPAEASGPASLVRETKP